MALVRCPTHKIPYNDENPRGCPACAREKSGDRKSIMEELARAQRPAGRPSAAAPAATQAVASTTRIGQRTERPSVRHPLAVTTPPKQPTVVEGPLGRLRRKADQRRLLAGGGALIVILSAFLLLTSGPRYTAGVNPPTLPDADARPLPLNPNTPITLAFSALGTKPPKQNPDDSRLFRYTYGSDLIVDALGGQIYAITLRIPNRTWRGIRAGLDQRRAEGELALLGTPEQIAVSNPPAGPALAGYVVYGSLDTRPSRTLRAEVRPPNGCFDVLVDLQPQAIGTIQDGNERYVAVAHEGSSPVWVVTQVRIVSRSMRGPYSPDPVCQR